MKVKGNEKKEISKFNSFSLMLHFENFFGLLFKAFGKRMRNLVEHLGAWNCEGLLIIDF